MGERSAVYIITLGERQRLLTYSIQHSYKITIYITTMAEKVKVEPDAAPSSVAGLG